MNFLFFTVGNHPDMDASSIRQNLIAQGLTELGHSIDIIVKDRFKFSKFKFKNINYIFIRGNTNNKSRIIRQYLRLISIYNSIKEIKSILKAKQIDFIISYPSDFICNFILIYLAKKNGVKIFHERTELPYTVLPSGLFFKIEYYLYLKFVLPAFKGIFVINNRLESFINIYNTNTKKILTVVDLDFFSIKPSNSIPFNYIGYCGKISGSKDGVPILIEAFSIISKKFPDLKLLLIGDNSNRESITETLNKIEELNLIDKVIFTGLIKREEMPRLLANAKVLAVAKPNNEQNSGNFPIKVGEYLSTGVPVVVTNVGEIPFFIENGVSGFIADPDSPQDFARALEEALTDSKRSKDIGKRGQQIAEERFNYKIQAKELLNYMLNINS